MHKILFIFLLVVLSQNYSFAQVSTSNDTLQTQAIIYNGDTISYQILEFVHVYGKMTRAQMYAQKEYNRLRNAVYVTYPYARRAGLVMNDINAHLVNTENKESRKKYILSREKDLKKEFSDPLSNLSVYQGKVLMKLINRETGNNCYEIIKEYKGAVTARLYQTVAFFFSSNLKQTYEARDEDKVIESFVQEVQRMYGYPEIRSRASL